MINRRKTNQFLRQSVEMRRKDRRAGRKEKGDKDRTEKQKLRKLKLASPTVPSSEPDVELDRTPAQRLS